MLVEPFFPYCMKVKIEQMDAIDDLNQYMVKMNKSRLDVSLINISHQVNVQVTIKLDKLFIFRKCLRNLN